MRSISSAASESLSRPLEPRMPYRTSACTPSRSWSFSLRAGSVRRRTPFLPSSYSPVEAMRSERWMTPGTYSRPAEPMPFIRPNLAPLALTHSGPFGPSTTWGMRSFSAEDAFAVNRSGGSQIRSTCPSAEMTSYFIGSFLRSSAAGPECAGNGRRPHGLGWAGARPRRQGGLSAGYSEGGGGAFFCFVGAGGDRPSHDRRHRSRRNGLDRSADGGLLLLYGRAARAQDRLPRQPQRLQRGAADAKPRQRLLRGGLSPVDQGAGISPQPRGAERP